MAWIGSRFGGVERERSVDTCPHRTGISDYLVLLKPRVMTLVVFTGAAGLAAAPGAADPATVLVVLLAMAAGSGGCGALNMWYDADIDALMGRTLDRPIPSGRVSGGEALFIGTVLSAGSIIALYVLINSLSAALLAFTIGFYVLVYTMGLKRRTPQNIVIGGLAGGLPPVIGWAAAAGSIDHRALVLCLIILLWTPPHFWALAIARASDYEKARVPMMPVVAGAAATARQIFAYAILLVAVSFLPAVLGMAGPIYAIAVSGLNGVLVWRVADLWRVTSASAPASRAALRLFAFSILYLFALFAAVIVDAR
ncbi:MAG: heme o synthase [Hyphomicrobium sp.]|uniref:heme o synthase n=1 Tax=Hyphomicrobium sp. TaxID=82 RepID=UPI00132C54EE|nr:heme o synthase [Hyphomicrobium sp.]KAB2942600.1 MAG: protoheme IX farnesyltransferase [Hyphomicrobium sp.]MBZ0208583.1 heme o synthase [Hyphomicrobium sp.]